MSLSPRPLFGIFLVTLGLINSGCQLTYLAKNAKGQLQLLTNQKNVAEVQSDERLSPEQKRKILLAKEAKEFAENMMGLKRTKNYTTYIDLGRPYVSYVVSAAEKWQLKQFVFKYPLFGEMPYKGYFEESDAKQEEQELKTQELDTYLRGVAAYSTLGWLKDPILSSMLNYSDEDLVNTIIHETVHATIYIKNNADFNERLATFLGNYGAEHFYLIKEGPHSQTLQKIKNGNEDDKIFSKFISSELDDLKKWYANIPDEDKTEDARIERLNLIKDNFYTKIHPNLKTKGHYGFNKSPLNNARLLVMKTYLENLDSFELLMNKCKSSYPCFLEKVMSLEKSPAPEQDLTKLLSSM